MSTTTRRTADQYTINLALVDDGGTLIEYVQEGDERRSDVQDCEFTFRVATVQDVQEAERAASLHGGWDGIAFCRVLADRTLIATNAVGFSSIGGLRADVGFPLLKKVYEQIDFPKPLQAAFIEAGSLVRLGKRVSPEVSEYLPSDIVGLAVAFSLHSALPFAGTALQQPYAISRMFSLFKMGYLEAARAGSAYVN